MRTVDDYLDQARDKHALRSDRALARVLDCDSTTLSSLRRKRSWPSDDLMVKLADLADVPRDQALLELAAWRTAGTPAGAVWHHLAARLCAAVVAFLVVAGCYDVDDGNASPVNGLGHDVRNMVHPGSVYYGEEALGSGVGRPATASGARRLFQHSMTKPGAGAPMQQDTATHVVSESSAVPLMSLILGYGSVVPFWIGAVAAWVLDGEAAVVVVYAVILWGGLILAFLSGVRRGLSFRTEGGPTVAQLAVSMGLFAVALAAFLLPWNWAALLLMIAGYGTLAVIDPIAARRGEAPLFFARLRPVQMPLIVAALAVCLARELI